MIKRKGHQLRDKDKDHYYFKGKPYVILWESKMKISDLRNVIHLNWWQRFLLRLIFGKNQWLDIVIYKCMYDNPEGKIWVREKSEFYRLFSKNVNIPGNGLQ
jgi:hypothetical protein